MGIISKFFDALGVQVNAGRMTEIVASDTMTMFYRFRLAAPGLRQPEIEDNTTGGTMLVWIDEFRYVQMDLKRHGLVTAYILDYAIDKPENWTFAMLPTWDGGKYPEPVVSMLRHFATMHMPPIEW